MLWHKASTYCVWSWWWRREPSGSASWTWKGELAISGADEKKGCYSSHMETVCEHTWHSYEVRRLYFFVLETTGLKIFRVSVSLSLWNRQSHSGNLCSWSLSPGLGCSTLRRQSWRAECGSWVPYEGDISGKEVITVVHRLTRTLVRWRGFKSRAKLSWASLPYVTVSYCTLL